MDTLPARDSLCAFRAAAPACFRQRADILFELIDALLTSGTVPSPVHLSVAPVHRRGWGSLSGGLAHGHLAQQPVRDRIARSP